MKPFVSFAIIIGVMALMIALAINESRDEREAERMAEVLAARKLCIKEFTYTWQQGEWFRVPLEYRNFWARKDMPCFIYSRDKFAEYLKTDEGAYHFGYGLDGQYDPSLTANGGATLAFAITLPEGAPAKRVTADEPDITDDPDDPDDVNVARVALTWAGGNTLEAFESELKKFKNYYKHRGEAPEIGKGHFRWGDAFGSSTEAEPIISKYKTDEHYQLYEKSGSYVAILRCRPSAHFAKSPAQPTCDGHIKDMKTGAFISVQYPEQIMREADAWLIVAKAVFNLIETWRMEE